MLKKMLHGFQSNIRTSMKENQTLKLLNSLSTPIIGISLNKTITYTNEIGGKFLSILSTSERKLNDQYWKSFQKEASFIVSRQNEIYTFSKINIQDEHETFFQGTDVTQLFALQNFPEQNPNPVFKIGADGEILYCNSSSKQILVFWKTNIGDPLPSPFKEMVLGAKRETTLEHQIGERIFSFNIVSIPELQCFNIYGTDITSSKENENLLQQIHELENEKEQLAVHFQEQIGVTIHQLYEKLENLSSRNHNLNTQTQDVTKQAIQGREQGVAVYNHIENLALTSANLNNSIQKIALQSKEINSFVHEALMRLSNTLSEIKQIEKSVRQVSKVLGIIDDISKQTKLLALNASIEAARVGKVGRGFGVVASEVKNLAHTTQRETKFIAEIIHNMNQTTITGLESIYNLNNSLVEIGSLFNEFVEQIQQQSNFTDLISKNASASSEKMDSLQKNLQQITEGVLVSNRKTETNTKQIKILFEVVTHLEEVRNDFIEQILSRINN